MKKGLLLAAGSILIITLAAGFFFYPQLKMEYGRAALFRVKHDSYYVLGPGSVEKKYDESWNTYIVVTGDQFNEPDSMEVSFSRDEDHLVILYSNEREVNARWIFRAGTHKIDLSEGDSYVYISAHDEDENSLNITVYSAVPTIKGNYSGKYLSVLGDSISAFEGYLTEGCFAGYHAGRDMKVSDMWWYEMARQTGMNICAVNASGGSGVTELADPKHMGNGERCENLDSSGHSPDVICVLLGINDFFRNVDQEQFIREYGEMVQRIQKNYPGAELFLCTYFELPGEYKAGVDDLNRIIGDTADKYGVRVLDLHGSNLSVINPEKRFKDYQKKTGQGVHPNAVGQKIIGRWAAGLLNEEEK